MIQIEPELLDELRQGKEIVSEIPDDLQHVRRFRIRVGDSPVPREKLPPRTDADETQRSALSISDDPQNAPTSNTQINEPPQLLPSRGGAYVPPEETPTHHPINTLTEALRSQLARVTQIHNELAIRYREYCKPLPINSKQLIP